MKNQVLKIGHRGAKGYVPENTLESIQKALALGVDGIEVDVHLLQTGQLVVFHDFTLDRLTDSTGEVAMKTLDELREITVDGKYKIPTLLEVLDEVNHQCLLNIELKGETTAFETCKSIQMYVETEGWQFEDFMVSSFNFEQLQSVYNINKKIPLAVLAKEDLNQAIEFAQTIKATAIHPEYQCIDQAKVKQLQKLGFKVNVWTVNEMDDIKRMKSYGVDGIISDFPDRL